MSTYGYRQTLTYLKISNVFSAGWYLHLYCFSPHGLYDNTNNKFIILLREGEVVVVHETLVHSDLGIQLNPNDKVKIRTSVKN